MGGKVFRNTLRSGLHGIVAFRPTCWTNLPVFLKELECLNDSEMFVDIASEREIIHRLVLNDALLVDEEGGPHGDPSIRVLDAIVLSDGMFYIRHNRKRHGTNAALFDGGVSPGMMSEL